MEAAANLERECHRWSSRMGAEVYAYASTGSKEFVGRLDPRTEATRRAAALA